jgi:hypothetical protein
MEHCMFELTCPTIRGAFESVVWLALGLVLVIIAGEELLAPRYSGLRMVLAVFRAIAAGALFGMAVGALDGHRRGWAVLGALTADAALLAAAG